MANEIEQANVKPLIPSLVPSKSQAKAFRAADQPFLPSIKLLQGASAELENPKNSGGDWYISQEELNLGKDFLVMVFGRRNHALKLKDRTKVEESFNPESPIFKNIANTRLSQADRQAGHSVFWGDGDWLFYLVEHQKFVTYFAGRRSHRPASHNLIDLLREHPDHKTFCIKSFFETKAFGPKLKMWVPQITLAEESSSGPIEAEVTASVKIFYDPVINEAQVIEAPNTTDDR